MTADDDIRDIRELKDSPLANPVRLAIALYLLPRRGAYFSSLAKALGLTRGNLRHHLNIMLKYNIIKEKYTIRNRPRKYIELTLKGAEETHRIINLIKKISEKRSQ